MIFTCVCLPILNTELLFLGMNQPIEGTSKPSYISSQKQRPGCRLATAHVHKGLWLLHLSRLCGSHRLGMCRNCETLVGCKRTVMLRERFLGEDETCDTDTGNIWSLHCGFLEATLFGNGMRISACVIPRCVTFARPRYCGCRGQLHCNIQWEAWINLDESWMHWICNIFGYHSGEKREEVAVVMQVMFDPASMDHELLSAFGLLPKFCATCRDGSANQQLLEAHAEGTILGAESAIFKRLVVRDDKKFS